MVRPAGSNSTRQGRWAAYLDEGIRPVATYADLSLFKAGMKITATDRDTMLNAALEDASRAIDSATGRRDNGFTLDASATARTYGVDGRVVWERNGRHRLLIDEIGASAGVIVEVGDGTTWTTLTDTRMAPDNALADGHPITALTSLFGWGCDQARVTAKWGWPAVPSQVRRAALILATRLYRRKDSPEGVASGGSDFGAIRLARQDPDVQQLLQPYMLPGIA